MRPRTVTELRRLIAFLLLPLALIVAGCGLLSTATPAPPVTPGATTPAPSVEITPIPSAEVTPVPSAATPPPSVEITPIPGVTGDAGSAHEAWLAGGITSYTWQIHYRCFCIDNGPLTVVVTDGAVDSVTGESGAMPTDRLMGFALTVDDLYGQLAATLGRGGSVTGTFDANGVPRELSVDPIKNATDDEYALEVLSFSPAS